MPTGESLPVEAGIDAQAYAGALVRRGEAIARVTATGTRTYFGRAAELVRVAHVTSTEEKAVLGLGATIVFAFALDQVKTLILARWPID